AGRAHARSGRPLIGAVAAAAGVEREEPNWYRRVEQRVPVDAPPGFGVGKPDANAEDVGTVAGRRAGRGDVSAARGRQAPRRAVDEDAGGAVVVVDEVCPQQRASRHAARAARAWKVLAEWPFRRGG